MKLIKNYLESFKVPKVFWRTLVLDAIGIALIIIILTSFGNLLTDKAYEISDGKSVEELKLILLSGDEQFNQEFSQSLQEFLAIFIIGSILVFLFCLGVFSYTRQRVWREILGQKLPVRPLWRWNWLTIVLGLFFIVFILVYGFIRVFTNNLLTFGSQNAAVIFSRSLNAFFFLIFIVFMFLAHYSFAQKRKVWESIGHSFSLIKNNLIIVFLLTALTGIIISVLNYGIERLFESLFAALPWVEMIITLGLTLMFFSWARLYLIRNL